ncbi:MAG: hypothetical protein ACOVNY_09600 [Chitinophagaceae bacterium]
MIFQKPYHQIHQVQQHWLYHWRLLQWLCLINIGFLVSYILVAFLHISTYWSILIACFFIAILFVYSRKKVDLDFVAKELNKQQAALESSASLLYTSVDTLSVLEQLQLQKISRILPTLSIQSPFKRYHPFIFLLTIFSFICFSLPRFNNRIDLNTSSFASIKKVSSKPLPAFIQSVKILLQPAAYLHEKAIEQQFCSIKTTTETIAQWQIKTSKSVNRMEILFNDSIRQVLQPINENKTVWTYSKMLTNSGFYQIEVENELSEIYQIEVLQDLPPIIKIQLPNNHTTIDFGQMPVCSIQGRISDDHGIVNAQIFATIARGKGESVQFTEKTIPLKLPYQQHQKEYSIQQTIPLQLFNMQPGDEMYFYIKVTDTYKQQSKSDVYVVELADTAALLEYDATINNKHFEPEYFRSERQIIIDVEQLLREKDTISLQQFNERCTDLGLDQKLLRLRYGKFLGEEDEENIGVEDPESIDAMEFGDPTQMLEAFGHHHDRSEDATYLDMNTKQQLKAVLNEMWKAELQLRSFKPKEALPFAYKALRLLKDLQQKSRAFVAKTNFKTTPLKPEKRLTGKLETIVSPLYQQNIIPIIDSFSYVQEAIQILSNFKQHQLLHQTEILQFSKAMQLLNTKAVAEPKTYLPALVIAKKIKKAIDNKQFSVPDVEIIQLQQKLSLMLSKPLALPSNKQKAASSTIGQQYFLQLQKSKE